MDSEKDDVPKVQDSRRQPEPVIYSTTSVILGILGYALILLLSKLANDNRSILFKSASYGQSPDHIIEVEITDREPKETTWEFIGTGGSANVDSYVRKVEGSKLFAFKGVVVIDEHISDVLKTFGSASTTPEWADMLQVMETIPVPPSTEHFPHTQEPPKKGLFGGIINKLKSITKKANAGLKETVIPADGDNILLNRPFPSSKGSSGNVNTYTLSDIVYQYYILPWPISPREFLFRRDFTIYPSTHSVTARYVSTIDERQPLPTKHSSGNTTPSGQTTSKHTIRAESPFTNWFFQDLETYCLQASISDAVKLSPQTTSTAHTSAATAHLGAHATKVCEEVLRAISSAPNAPNSAPNSTVKRASRRTYIEIESLVDNKGALPAWLVNYVQRSWAPKTLSAMAASVYKQATADRSKASAGGGDSGEGGGDGRGVVKFTEAW